MIDFLLVKMVEIAEKAPKPYVVLEITIISYDGGPQDVPEGTELFKLRTGAVLQAIPYRGSGESVTGVLGGQTTTAIVDPLPAIDRGEDALVAVALRESTRADHDTTSRRTNPKNTMLITPFNVKNAVFRRRRSPGDTIACS